MQKFFLALFVSSILFFMALPAYSYPEFIGYGYAACMTCHNNGMGGGQLNDYGRALWSAEIASRVFYDKSTTDEQIAERSGFPGQSKLPNWLKPAFKYRALFLRKNPGSGTADTTKFYVMQVDFGATVSDPDGKYMASITWGHNPPPTDVQTNKISRILAKEYFARLQLGESWWLYAGLLDIPFGIRNVDHTSFNRAPQGLTFRDQSQSVILQTAKENYEIAVDAFVGNPYIEEQFRMKGASITGEYQPAENTRVGASFMSSKNDLVTHSVVSVHYRKALSKGSAFQGEYGMIQDKPQLDVASTGSYLYLQSQFLLTRGYFLRPLIENYKANNLSGTPEQWKWGIGILAFPAPRYEGRIDLLNKTSIYKTQAQEDEWQMRMQFHVSL